MRRRSSSRWLEPAKVPLFVTAAVLCVLGGCASTPEPPPERVVPPPPPPVTNGPSAADIVARALAASTDDRFDEAARDLYVVARLCAESHVGHEAYLILASLELDPRNPNRDLAFGARLAQAYLEIPRRPAWTSPVIESLYLLALELGADDRLQGQPDSVAADTVPEGYEGSSSEGDGEARSGTGAVAAADLSRANAWQWAVDSVAAEHPPLECDDPLEQIRFAGLPPTLPGLSAAARIHALERDTTLLAERIAELARERDRLVQELERVRQTLQP